MKTEKNFQQISYIAPAAPATRRLAEGDEPYLRPEIGFSPQWFHDALGIDFGERWHTDPYIRRDSVIAMRNELERRFPGTPIGGIDRSDAPLDILTGTFGACPVAAIYGVPIRYASNNWPNCEHEYLSDEAMDRLSPPDLDANSFFQDLMAQVDAIGRIEGRIEGFLNWQGILNNAQRLRGQQIFLDMIDSPERLHRLLDAVCTTMIDACRSVRARQRQSGVDVNFFTTSNCLVNMISPGQYREFILPYDRRIAESFDGIGIHNCAWNANPYFEAYASVPGLAYIDMGMDSDLVRAREAIPQARRAIMYTPMDVANKSIEDIRQDFEKIADEYGPCDLVLADIELGTPDERVLDVIAECERITERYEKS